MVLLDQRGTGKSSPIRLSTLNAVGDEEAQARYCRYFRADSIVKDAEIVRKHLSPDNPSKPWSILGQSFGGFCCVEYLSKFPEGWSDALLSAVHACIAVLSVHGSPAGAVRAHKAAASSIIALLQAWLRYSLLEESHQLLMSRVQQTQCTRQRINVCTTRTGSFISDSQKT